jgi:hypothetical protein
MVRNKALMDDNNKPILFHFPDDEEGIIQRNQSHSFESFHIIPSPKITFHFPEGNGLIPDDEEGITSNSILSSFHTNHLNFNKPINIVFVYMLEKFLEKEFKDKLNVSDVSDPEFEQDFLESVQNIIMYINLKLIKSSDIIIEYGEIKKVAKMVVKDGVFVYDTEKYPIMCKRLRSSSSEKDKKINSKLGRILGKKK